MVTRPIFVPNLRGGPLVRSIAVEFTWHPGFSLTQKRKNITALHSEAEKRGIAPVLEVSSRSETPLGIALSAFNLRMRAGLFDTTVESAFQGSKVFEHGGPYVDLYTVSSLDAKRDPRIRNSGRIVGFHFDDTDYPNTPPTAFYDWIYINAIHRDPKAATAILAYAGFTDIEFNPERSLNCQAGSCALYAALEGRGWLDDALESFDRFRGILIDTGLDKTRRAVSSAQDAPRLI